jgi:signal transduction histidine kinase
VREQALQVQQIVNTVPEGVLLLNGKRQVVLANPSGATYLQLLAAAQVGDVIVRLGQTSLDEILMMLPEGLWHEIQENSRIFRVIARAIETGPATGGWVLAIHEVTQEHEIEQRVHRQERLAAVGQLAAGIAHDFNNIMAVIILYSQLAMRDPDLSPKLRDRLTTITQQGQRASELIEQILDFSRSAMLDLRPLDLTPLLKEQVKLWQRTLPENITIRLDYPTDQSAITVRADPTRLQQMFMNLIVNARDAMPEGGRLWLTLAREAVAADAPPPLPEMHAGEWVRITVQDSGMGIPPDVLPHIFEPFYTTKSPGKGTGLGLAQVYGIVGQHEGAIDVTSKVGEGTAFTIYLPALPLSQDDMALVGASPMILGKGETVLMGGRCGDARRAGGDVTDVAL